MAEGYKKITKVDINFPKFCLFFIESLKKEIDDTDFKVYNELEVKVNTYEFPYCYEAFSLVTKSFKRIGFDVKTPTFKLVSIDGIRHWQYKFLIKVSKGCEDLPF